MRVRLVAVILVLAGLLVAVGVGLAANTIASRSFTPGVDALPSAGSLAPRVPSRRVPPTTAIVRATTATRPKPKPKPAPKPVTTSVRATTVDDHGGGGGGGGGSSGGHGGGHGGDD